MNTYGFEIPGLVMGTFSLAVSALVGWAILRIFQPASPRMHRLVWIAVLLNGVMLWRFPIEIPMLDPVASNTTFLDSGLPDASGEIGNPGVTAKANTDTAMSQTGAAVAGLDSQNTIRSGSRQPGAIGATNVSVNRQSMNWPFLIALTWLVGWMLTLALFSLRYIRVYRKLRQATTADVTLQRELDQATKQFNIRKTIPLRLHPDLGPMLIATPFKTQVVVPFAFWSRLTSLQRNAILNHEVAHHVRHDIWKSMFATGLATVHWFNPMAWLALREFNQAAEWACDQQVGKTNSTERVGFARVLLSLSTGNGGYLVGASTMASSNLTLRVKRLLSNESTDPAGRRVLMAALIGMIAVLGWFNFRLVAAPAPTIPSVALSPAQEDESREKIEALSNKIRAGDDELAKKFLSALKTPSGVVAVSNRVGALREEMRQEASKSIIADYFESSMGGDFVDRLEREVALSKQDIANVRTALAELKTQMNGTTESDLLLVRFLNGDNAAEVLYFSQLRGEMRPGRSKVMEKLGQFIADDGTGKFVVRESVKDEFISQVEKFAGIEKHFDYLNKELKQWSSEVVAKDDLHKRIKEGLVRPDAAAVLLSRMDDGGSPRERIEKYFEFLETILVDTTEGLVIADEYRDRIVASVAEMDLHRQKIELMRGPIREVAEAINVRGEAEQLAKDLLSSEFGLSLVVINVGMSSPESIVNKIKSEVLEESDEGHYKIREDRLEAVTKFARDLLKKSRQVRRHVAILDEHIAQIENARLKTACDSFEGRMVLIEKIQAHGQSLDFKAWDRWIELVFEESGNGLKIRPETRDEISGVLEDAQLIEKEMQKDDF